MPIPYVLVPHANPARPTEPPRLYAQLTSSGEVSTRQLMNLIAERSTVSTADTAAVLESLLSIVPELLADGAIVRLGEFGSLSGSVRSQGVAREADFVAATMITAYQVRFRPGRELRRALARPQYRRVSPPGRRAEAPDNPAETPA